MFSIPRLNVVESNTGFSIEMLGRTGMEYREGDKAMSVESEILMTEIPTVAIWKNCIRAWKPPHDKEPLLENRREEIVRNISTALKWRNIQVKIL